MKNTFIITLLSSIFSILILTNAHSQVNFQTGRQDSFFYKVSFDRNNWILFDKSSLKAKGSKEIDSLTLSFVKKGNGLNIKALKKNTTLFEINALVLKSYNDTTEVYDLSGPLEKYDYLAINSVFECKIKSFQILNYDAVFKSDYLRNLFEKLFVRK